MKALASLATRLTQISRNQFRLSPVESRNPESSRRVVLSGILVSFPASPGGSLVSVRLSTVASPRASRGTLAPCYAAVSRVRTPSAGRGPAPGGSSLRFVAPRASTCAGARGSRKRLLRVTVRAIAVHFPARPCGPRPQSATGGLSTERCARSASGALTRL